MGGSERRSEPLAIVHPTPSSRKIVLGRLAMLVTVGGAWLYYVVSTIIRQLVDNPNSGFRFGFESISYLIVVTFLTFSALMYLMARQGALYRFKEHRRVPRGELDNHFANYKEAVTVLVPSYAEEPQVVRGVRCGRPPFRSSRICGWCSCWTILRILPSRRRSTALNRPGRWRGQIADALSAPAERANKALATFRERHASPLAAETPCHG